MLCVFLSAIAVSGLLWKLIYLVIALVVIGLVLWAIDKYIAPIPQPIRVAVAIIALLLAVLFLFGGL